MHKSLAFSLVLPIVPFLVGSSVAGQNTGPPGTIKGDPVATSQVAPISLCVTGDKFLLFPGYLT